MSAGLDSASAPALVDPWTVLGMPYVEASAL